MTPTSFRRRSQMVQLAVLGTAGGMLGLGAYVSDRPTFHRNVYRSMTDCAADYSTVICSVRGSQGPGKFFGPIYRKPNRCNAGDPGAGPEWNSRRTGVEPIDRGGFGTTSCDGGGRVSGG